MDMDERFHPAQAAIAAGDFEGLASILAGDPGLAAARSGSSHPTLLQCLALTMPPADRLEDMIDLLADGGNDLAGPLVAACGMGNVRAVAKLLELGARIEGDGGWSPLEEALYWGQDDAVTLLVGRGAVATNLRTAAGLGDMAYLARCFDPDGTLTPAAGEVASPFGPIAEAHRRDPRQVVGNALVFAAHRGRIEAVESLLGRGAEVNLIPAGFDYAGTALHYAAFGGSVETVDRLLRAGADPSIRDAKIGQLAEDWADHAGHRELAAHLRQIRERAG